MLQLTVYFIMVNEHTPGRLIKNEDSRIFYQRSSNSDALFLPSWYSDSSFTKDCVVTMRKGCDKVMGIGQLCCFHHLNNVTWVSFKYNLKSYE